MIEINLAKVKSRFKLPVVIGIDFNLLNIKLLILVLILYWLGMPKIEEYFAEAPQILESEGAQLRKDLNAVKQLGKKMALVEEQIKELEEQEAILNNKLKYVRKIIKFKKNPMGLLLFISRNIPEDVWLNEIKIQNDKLLVEGESQSYKSIGLFIEKLKESIFLGRGVKLEDSKTSTDEKSGKRFEVFKISATILRFD